MTEGAGHKEDISSTPVQTQSQNPFKGPIPYEEGDSFFGRDYEIEELFKLVRNEPLTLLFSRSGTGKSSLIKAGLIPHLRKNLEFLPVYIHLSLNNNKSSQDNCLSKFVIKRIEEELKRSLTNPELFSIIYPENADSINLFQFIHELKIFQIEKLQDGTINEYSIKPLLIFDQLEEIFFLQFRKNDLEFLYQEIRCLIENDIPNYLKDSFKDLYDEKIQNFRYSLKKKQKDYRILFAFREEFLPQFESLRNKIPFIRFTNSRFRLEPFSILTGANIITRTAPNIQESIANKISENLSAHILGFDDVRDDPFLLSLICHLIYPDLHKENDVSEERIKSLVDTAIDGYLEKIYCAIGEKTKEFIEMRLITPDGYKNSVNYNEILGDALLCDEIEMLINKQQYRLLSKGQFLDSTHVSLLHDRLLTPLLKRREAREIKKQEEALKEQEERLRIQHEVEQKEQEEILKRQHEAERKKQDRINRIRIYWVLGIAVIVISVIGLYSWVKFESRRNVNELLGAFRTSALGHDMENLDPTAAIRLADSALHQKDNELIRNAANEIYTNNAFYKNILAGRPDSTYISFDISDDGSEIMAGGSDGRVHMWDANGRKTSFSAYDHAPVVLVSFSMNNQLILTTSPDMGKIWDRTHKLITTISKEGAHVTTINFTGNGQKVIAGFSDGTLSVYNVEELLKPGIKASPSSYKVHDTIVVSAFLSRDGSELLTSTINNDAILWAVKDNVLSTKSVFSNENGQSMSARFTPFKDIILTASADGTIKLWNTNPKRGLNFPRDRSPIDDSFDDKKAGVMATLQPHKTRINAIAFSPDSTHILTGSDDNTACLIDLKGFKVKEFKGHTDRVNYVAFTNDNRIVTGAADHTLREWVMEDLLDKEYTSIKDPITCAAFARTGELFVGTASGKVNVISKQGDSIDSFQDNGDGLQVSWVQVSDKDIVVGSRSGFRVLSRDRNASTREREKLHVDKMGLKLSALELSPDNSKLAMGTDDGCIEVYDMRHPERNTISFRRKTRITSIAFSNDSKSFAVGSQEGRVILYHILDDTFEKEIIYSDKVQDFSGSLGVFVTFSPDDKYLMICAGDKNANLYSLAENQVTVKFPTQKEFITTGAIAHYNKDTLLVFTGRSDGFVSIWKMVGNRKMFVRSFQAFNSAVSRLAVSPDNNHFITINFGTQLKVWNVNTLPMESLFTNNKIDYPIEKIKMMENDIN